MIAPAVDYAAIGRAIVRGVRQILDADDQQVIFLQPEIADAARPALPYISVYFKTPAKMFGWDSSFLSVDGNVESLSGPRSFDVEMESYAETHPEANGIMATLQAAIFSMACADYLRSQVGLAVYDASDVTDDSKALDTGFEGRAKMTVTFGVLSSLRLPSLGTIESATVEDSAFGDVITIGDTDNQ